MLSTLAYQGTMNKPPYSYAALIGQALFSTPDLRMALADIYTWIMQKYPYFRKEDSGWQNSIRHNLSLNQCFIKTQRGPQNPGKLEEQDNRCRGRVAGAAKERFGPAGLLDLPERRCEMPHGSRARLFRCLADDDDHGRGLRPVRLRPARLTPPVSGPVAPDRR